MPVLRLLLIILVLLNLLALATGQGWLGTSVPPGEPERLTNQINPELIVLLPHGIATPTVPLSTPPVVPPSPEGGVSTSDASSDEATRISSTAPGDPPTPVEALPVAPHEATVCRLYEGLRVQQAERIEKAALSISPTLLASRETIEPASGWWVRLPPTGSLQAAERRAHALRALGITDLFIIREAGPNQYAISLGLFRTEASARQHLSDLEAKRVRGAEIAVRTPAVFRVAISGPAALVDRLVTRLTSEVPNTPFSECPQ